MKMLIMLFFATVAVAQTQKATLDVRGNCGMCKARIEQAAFAIKGVKHAAWEANTEQLKVFFNPKKTSVDSIAVSISAIGHEANGIAVKEEVYADLPMCCQYKDAATKAMHDK
jgi:mercuric ion binding protein